MEKQEKMTIQDAHNKYCKEALELMLCKNADYSGAIDNISLTGRIGVSVRALDKAARYHSLTMSKVPAKVSESRKDTLLDMLNYAVIGLMLENGEWGK